MNNTTPFARVFRMFTSPFFFLAWKFEIPLVRQFFVIYVLGLRNCPLKTPLETGKNSNKDVLTRCSCSVAMTKRWGKRWVNNSFPDFFGGCEMAFRNSKHLSRMDVRPM